MREKNKKNKTHTFYLSVLPAPPIPAVQPDRVQAAGDPELPERQRGGEQQDEAGQAGALQRDGGRALRAGRVLRCRRQEAGYRDR